MSLEIKSKVLVVEDSPMQSRIIADLFHALGYIDVTTANDGYTALDLMKAKRFDLIISDWDMPRVSGYQLLLVSRNDPKHQDTIFLMASANTSQASEEKAIRAKASGYLCKPFGVTQLRRAIMEATDPRHRANSGFSPTLARFV